MRKFVKQHISTKSAALYEPLLGPVLRGLRREVCQLRDVCVPKGSAMQAKYSMLDCCCGAGGLLHMALQEQNSFWQGIGLDMSESMLHEAQKRVPQADFIQGDGTCLPLATQSIHVATCCMALHTLPYVQAQQILQELLRVAQYVIVADYTLTERNIYFPSACLAHGVEALVGGEHYACYKDFMRGGAVEGFLYKQGLEVRERRMTLGGAGLVLLLDSKLRAE